MSKQKREIGKFKMDWKFFCLHCNGVSNDNIISALRPGGRFSKVPIINVPGKLSLFTLKIEVSKVLHLTR